MPELFGCADDSSALIRFWVWRYFPLEICVYQPWKLWRPSVCTCTLYMCTMCNCECIFAHFCLLYFYEINYCEQVRHLLLKCTLCGVIPDGNRFIRDISLPVGSQTELRWRGVLCWAHREHLRWQPDWTPRRGSAWPAGGPTWSHMAVSSTSELGRESPETSFQQQCLHSLWDTGDRQAVDSFIYLLIKSLTGTDVFLSAKPEI